MDALSCTGPTIAEAGAPERAAVPTVAFLSASFLADTFTPAVQPVLTGKMLQIWLDCLE